MWKMMGGRRKQQRERTATDTENKLQICTMCTNRLKDDCTYKTKAET